MTTFNSKWNHTLKFVLGTIAVLLLISAIIALGARVHRVLQLEEFCTPACAPYAHRITDGKCECMDEQKRWVVQEQ